MVALRKNSLIVIEDIFIVVLIMKMLASDVIVVRKNL